MIIERYFSKTYFLHSAHLDILFPKGKCKLEPLIQLGITQIILLNRTQIFTSLL